MNDTIKREKTIAEARAELGISRKFLAELLEVSTRTIKAWEHGERTPKPIYHREIRRFLTVKNQIDAIYRLEAKINAGTPGVGTEGAPRILQADEPNAGSISSKEVTKKFIEEESLKKLDALRKMKLT